jgi:N-acetylglucosaminyl-diphospho-decaprenol L-rhamnosyltransferase
VDSNEATVYIPTLDGGERLAACLRALLAQTVPVRVVVADNGPGDGCRELLETDFPEVDRIGFGRNLGFGPALNRAISRFGSGPVILLNDDAVARPDFIEALMLERHAEMTAAVLVSERDPSRIDSAGVLTDQTLMGFDYLSGEPVSVLDSAGDPMGPTGGAALYERASFERVGGFDERIFLYYEDLDLNLRIRAIGGNCRLAGSARAVHGYSETLGPRSDRKYAMTGWSRGYLMRRYGVMSGLGNAAAALGRESAICVGQIVSDRTFAGLTGRISGWRQARGLPERTLPSDAVMRTSIAGALALRRARHSR